MPDQSFQAMSDKIVTIYERYIKEHDIEDSQNYAVLKLVEELGEFAQALIIHNGLGRKNKSRQDSQKAVADELADILGFVVVVAKKTGIDLEQAVENKWFCYLKKDQNSQETK